MCKLFNKSAGTPRPDLVQLGSNYFSNFILNKMDWIKKNLWQTLLVAFITVVFSTVGSVIVYSSTKKADKLENSASTEYVNQETGKLKVYIDVNNDELKSDIRRLEDTKADKDAIKALDSKIDIVVEWVKSQKQ